MMQIYTSQHISLQILTHLYHSAFVIYINITQQYDKQIMLLILNGMML